MGLKIKEREVSFAEKKRMEKEHLITFGLFRFMILV